MSLARAFKDWPDIVAALPTALLYYLASPSAPSGLRDDIVASISSGERVDAAQVREMVLAARKQGRGRRAVKVRAGPKEDTVSFSPVEQTRRNARSSPVKTDRDDPAETEPAAEQAGGRKAVKVEGPQDDRAGPKEDSSVEGGPATIVGVQSHGQQPGSVPETLRPLRPVQWAASEFDSLDRRRIIRPACASCSPAGTPATPGARRWLRAAEPRRH
jgi:hypothetical protein